MPGRQALLQWVRGALAPEGKPAIDRAAADCVASMNAGAKPAAGGRQDHVLPGRPGPDGGGVSTMCKQQAGTNPARDHNTRAPTKERGGKAAPFPDMTPLSLPHSDSTRTARPDPEARPWPPRKRQPVSARMRGAETIPGNAGGLKIPPQKPGPGASRDASASRASAISASSSAKRPRDATATAPATNDGVHSGSTNEPVRSSGASSA